MAREMPVGTIRDWAQGPVIKAHEPIPPFSSGWIPLKTNLRLERIGKDCDSYARDILSHKMPINGEKFLDHEINEFGIEDGNEKFFNADNFKKYEGFHGSGRYAFRNEFSRLFMKSDMDLDEEIMRAYQEENYRKGGTRDDDKLTSQEKRQIREEVKRNFKESDSVITVEKAEKILEVVKRTRNQVEEGLDFKDEGKKKAYEEFRKVADNLIDPYELIKVKREKKFGALEIIEQHFQDNWGVRESCKDYIQKKFDEYVRKYSNEISRDSLQEQIDEFGVNIEMEPQEFYSKIYDKAKGSSYDFLEKFVGKEITVINYGKSMRVKLSKKYIKAILDNEVSGEKLIYTTSQGVEGDLIENLERGHLKLSPEYNELNNNFKDLIYLRFVKKYGKSVEGDWNLEHLPAIQNLEYIINELPKGHFLTNDHLNLITNKTYKGGSNGGYAWYSPSESRINLSADCVERSTVWGVLSNPTEFKSVMLHEIGHAVDEKLERDRYYNRKKFVVDCGWTYQSPELRAGKTATGDDKDIPRTGSNSSITLITDYSKKSPSEAFAEYYSFYNLNKHNFDKFFETGDNKYLMGHSKKIAKSIPSEKSIQSMLPYRVNTVPIERYNQYREIEERLSDKGYDHQITLNNPWEMSLSKEEKRKLNPMAIRQRKNYSIHSMPPVVAVKDGLNRHIIDGGVRQEVAKMNRQLIPTIEISKEFYYKMKSSGFSDEEISTCVYTKNADKYVPKQIAPEVTVHGLIYRDSLIHMDQILENIDAIRTMKEICESKELEKALSEIFEKSINQN
jgi:hypothetical protein